MSILPPNEPQKTIDVPHNFFIWGATMSGKSYLAEHFPNPLFLNTDGNALENKAPSIQIRNIKGPNSTLRQDVIKQLDEIILALMNEKHGYQTIVVDVVDDLVVMLEQAIAIRNRVETLPDVPYGRGFAMFNTIFQEFILELKALDMNVVYISRIAEVNDGVGTETRKIPSLKTKYYNVINGNSDLVIQTKRVGTNYIRRITDQRRKYYRDDITDKGILRVLNNIPGVFSTRPQTKGEDK
ncbi:AAA family ATPase [Schleiferilactobacillus harbinensis]|uniref:Phage NTP-binding protein n=1 Tax=Schleiferilactobacillus harbinensis DSM 16991 TaxID=1122147 RepID=A0A0R1XAE5_9LACO|nr:AAA family ATPase [Schleiferilactobacillus harbinensis]KRM24857.1 hypothetical protein FC91_GL001222 [Schleiferilactobacillus harbinensis DSM 16991]QFR65065.1 AAA family ATPase [Schleiferilactobacillus harbinensis]